jgi:hypothetical protein
MASGYEKATGTIGEGFVFGIPVGDLGWFTSLLIGLALGMAAFFGATFLGIFYILMYNQGGHHVGAAALDFADSYKRVGLPAGLLVAVSALGYLGVLWAKRKLRRA